MRANNGNNSDAIDTKPIGYVTPVYTKRNMKIYSVPESELDTLSAINARGTIFFSTCSFFISTALGFFLSGMYADNLRSNPVGTFIFHYGTIFSLIIALIFLILGVLNYKDRNKTLKTIREESVPS